MRAAGTLKNYLGRCVHRAFTVAKRVRTETALVAAEILAWWEGNKRAGIASILFAYALDLALRMGMR